MFNFKILKDYKRLRINLIIIDVNIIRVIQRIKERGYWGSPLKVYNITHFEFARKESKLLELVNVVVVGMFIEHWQHSDVPV